MTKYLMIGPHPDDVELGCLASVLSMVKEGDEVTYMIMSKCLNIPRNNNILKEIIDVDNALNQLFLGLKVEYNMTLYEYNNQRLKEQHMEIRMRFEAERNFNPDFVFVSSPKDRHQDHSYIGEEALRIFRKQTVLHYEIPQATQNFNPTMFVEITEPIVEISLDILALYQSQKRQSYMRKNLLTGTLRHRGNTIGKDYAQAFEIGRFVIDGKK